MRVMKTVLESISPYSQGKHVAAEKLDRELPDDYEKRTWRDRMHTDDKGFVFIPPMAFKNCLSEAAKFISMQIPGKGKSTFTKHFEAGILVLEGLSLPVKKEAVAGNWLYVPADGKRGGSKRVSRCFPTIPSWKGEVTFHVLDDIITLPTFKEHLEAAGKFIGIGVFRPRNNGFYGRFQVKSVKEEKIG